jgi:hypothetical protein
MIANHIIGFYKFVLFVDEVGIERSSGKIVEKILSEQNVVFQYYENDSEINKHCSVILKPISKLELDNNENLIAKIIQKLKTNQNVTQIFGWASRKNINSRLLIPFLEHMSEIVITIKSDKILTILTKRKFGSAKLKDYQHELFNGKTGIKEHKEDKSVVASTESEDPQMIGTFKIGEYNKNELEAKKNLKLPFELM